MSLSGFIAADLLIPAICEDERIHPSVKDTQKKEEWDMEQKGKVVMLRNNDFTPAPERVLITNVCRDLSYDGNGRKVPSVLTPNGFQDGFGEYSTHLPDEYKFYTNQPCYGLSFLEANVVGPTYLHYPYRHELEMHLSSGRYDVLCISAYTWSLPWAMELAERAKRDYGIREVWLGGYAVMTDDPLMSRYFDRLFWGYSESTLNQAIGKGALKINELKHPDLTTKAYFLGRHSNVGHVIFRRGCPNRCTYCADPVFHPGGESCLSLTAIEEILDSYKSSGINSIYISNQDTRILDRYGSSILDAMRTRGMRFGMLTSFPSLLAKGLDGIKELHDKGLVFLLLGLESLNETNLEKTKRRAKVKMMYDTLKLLKELRIIVTTTYMICFEDDTEETIREAKNKMIHELGVTVNLFNITMPLPATPMYWDYKNKGLITDWDWARWTGNYLVWKHPTISSRGAEELLGELRAEVNSPVYNPNVRALWEGRTDRKKVAAN
jgi:pyruvate-formate lyase-activating enzyme